MSDSEAIKRLKEVQAEFNENWIDYGGVNEAFEKAYQALERPKGDLISRQDAIDALEEQLDYLAALDENENPTAEGKWYGVNWARNTITDLPPAKQD